MKSQSKPYEPKPYDHLEEADTNACSVTECTGLITQSPITEEEYEAYLDVYEFTPILPEEKQK